MPSSGDLQKKLKKLSDHQSALWSAFDKVENSAALPSFPTLRFIALHKYAMPLCKSGYLSWFLYPLFPIVACYITIVMTSYFLTDVQFSGVGMSINSLFLFFGFILTILTMGWTSKSEKAFHNAYSNSVLRENQYAKYSFGFDHTALMTHYFFEVIKLEKINKAELASILKIIKAKNELDDVSGITAENFKKFLLKLLWGLPVILYQNFGAVKVFSNKVLNSNSIFVKGYLIFVILYLPYAFYVLIFSSIKVRKKFKRYQIALNIVHESWV